MPPLNRLQKTGLALAISQGLCLSTQAATLTVNNSGDSGEGCTFREAVARINAGGALDNGCVSAGSAFGDNDTILFDVDAVNGLTSEVVISKDVSINPSGDSVTISSTGTDRVLGITGGATVNINRLMVTGGNTSNFAGGIGLDTGTSLSLTNSTVTDNRAALGGGGIGVATDAVLSLTNSTISNNQADSRGGGIAVARDGSLTLSNSTITNNTSLSEGGGIAGLQGANLQIANSTVSANTSSRNGGGIVVQRYSILSIINSTITQNFATSLGGGLSTENLSLTLHNNLIVGNRTDSARAGELRFSSQALTNSSVRQNLIGDSYLDSNLTLQTDNTIVDADELPNILSPLADNGGPTLTHALPEGSPAIDAGDSTFCAAAPINNRDQRGVRRGANCDIGAFEVFEPDDGGFFVIPLKNGKIVVIPE